MKPTRTRPAPGATRTRPAALAASGVALLAVAVSLAGCGGGWGGPALSVSPRTGTPRSELRFSFIALAATGARAHTQISDTLSVMGQVRAGCVGFHSTSLAPVAKGGRLSVSVGPAELGGPWCTGAYTARVEELARPVCRAGQACPQFIRVVGIVGRTTFRIRG